MTKRSTIYTRLGDQGKTSLGDRCRIAKHELRVQAMGDVDELNCALGIVLSSDVPTETLRAHIVEIQHQLFDLGSELSGARQNVIQQTHIDHLEKLIDKLDLELPKVKAFILPGGGIAAAQCHMARAICRRAERAVTCTHEKKALNTFILTYLNRLSDLLFVIARTVSYEAGISDNIWQKHRDE